MSMEAAMAAALAQLRAMLEELEDKQAGGVWVFDSANLGGTIDQVIFQAHQTIDFLDGELRERIYRPGDFAEGVKGPAAWEHWRDTADALGQQLARALGTMSRWSAGSVLQHAAYNVAEAAQKLSEGLPWLALLATAVAAVVLVGGRR